jgi:hypothetical protein
MADLLPRGRHVVFSLQRAGRAELEGFGRGNEEGNIRGQLFRFHGIGNMHTTATALLVEVR